MEKFKFIKELIKVLYEIRNAIKGNNEGGDINKITSFAINDAPVGVISSFDFSNIDDVFIPIDEFVENLQDYLNQTASDELEEEPTYKVYTFVYDKEPNINNFCNIRKLHGIDIINIEIGQNHHISEIIKGTNLYYIYIPTI